MISLYQFRGVDLISWLPGVITFRVSLPFKEVLQLSPSSMTSVAPDVLDFVFGFSCDKVRWGSGEVGTVRVRFDIWGEKTGVKHGMYVPLGRQLQLIRHRGYDSDDLEGSMMSRGHFD